MGGVSGVEVQVNGIVKSTIWDSTSRINAPW